MVAQLADMEKIRYVACVMFLLDSMDLDDLMVSLLSLARVRNLARAQQHGVIFTPPPGDIWECLETFFVVSWVRMRSRDRSWPEMLLDILQCTGQLPMTQLSSLKCQ